VSARIGYSRFAVEGAGSAIEAQLFAAKVDHVILRDQTSRPDEQLKQALDGLSSGDVLVVVSSDNLSPSVEHFVRTIAGLYERGIMFHSLTESALCTDGDTVSQGEVFQALDSLRRRLISESTKEGMLRAAAEGCVPGRPRLMTAEKLEAARALRRANCSYSKIGRALQVSETTVRLSLKASGL
tara:strand:- start:1922 stop:2473 length:552 start_codon:yes stop_codon:yes gene_type:complete